MTDESSTPAGGATADGTQELAQRIARLAQQPAEVGAEHQAAQSALAGMGYDLARLVLDANLCTCEVADTGTGESGPSLAITQLSPDCPVAEHRAAWRDGEEEQRSYELSLYTSRLELQANRTAELPYHGPESAARNAGFADGIRWALQLCKDTNAGRSYAQAEEQEHRNR